MQLYFIRHGQSVNNRLWDETQSNKGRSQDPELTDTGREQARRLGEFMRQSNPEAVKPNGYDTQNCAGFGINFIYTSLMVRAVETASIVSRALGLPLQALGDLHECGGIYLEDEATGEKVGKPGSTRAFFRERYPELVLPEICTDEGWWNRPFEEEADRNVRAERLVRELVERHGKTDDRVAVVSHAGFYNHVIRVILKLPESPHVWFMLNNTAFSRIDLHEGWTDVVYTNRAEHLPWNLIT